MPQNILRFPCDLFPLKVTKCCAEFPIFFNVLFYFEKSEQQNLKVQNSKFQKSLIKTFGVKLVKHNTSFLYLCAVLINLHYNYSFFLFFFSDPYDIAAVHNHFVVVDNTNNVKMYNNDGTMAFDFPQCPIVRWKDSSGSPDCCCQE